MASSGCVQLSHSNIANVLCLSFSELFVHLEAVFPGWSPVLLRHWTSRVKMKAIMNLSFVGLRTPGRLAYSQGRGVNPTSCHIILTQLSHKQSNLIFQSLSSGLLKHAQQAEVPSGPAVINPNPPGHIEYLLTVQSASRSPRLVIGRYLSAIFPNISLGTV